MVMIVAINTSVTKDMCIRVCLSIISIQMFNSGSALSKMND